MINILEKMLFNFFKYIDFKAVNKDNHTEYCDIHIRYMIENYKCKCVIHNVRIISVGI